MSWQPLRRGPLWLAIRLPLLPLHGLGLLAEAATASAWAVSEQQRIICLNAAAVQQGIRYAMAVSTAQLLGDCQLQARNRAQEAVVLDELAAELYQFTPHIEYYHCTDPDQAGLQLEISRCLRLWGGVQPLCSKITALLEHSGLHYALGLAHSAPGAWLLSFADYPITGEENTQLFITRLKALPIQLVQEFPQAVVALEKMGFQTLGDIARQIEAQTISGLKKRLGQEFSDYLCELFAIEQNFQQGALFNKPPPLYQPVEYFTEQAHMEFPVAQIQFLQQPIELLLHKLADYNRKRQLSCQRIEWDLQDIHGRHQALVVTCDHPQSHWQLFYDLTLIQLESRPLSIEVDRLDLICRHFTPAEQRSASLGFDKNLGSQTRGTSFTLAMAKLKARLGEAAVSKISYADSLLPEQTSQSIELQQVCNQQLPVIYQQAPRPTWLLASPAAIEVRPRGLYYRGYLTLLSGPERVQSHWWDTPCGRDYYVAQRTDHARLWIFFDVHKKAWFVHGVFR
jgi:protein ImuB